jgi:hypothetical protein
MTRTSNDGPWDPSEKFAATESSNSSGRDLSTGTTTQAIIPSAMISSDTLIDFFTTTHGRRRSWRWSNEEK